MLSAEDLWTQVLLFVPQLSIMQLYADRLTGVRHTITILQFFLHNLMANWANRKLQQVKRILQIQNLWIPWRNETLPQGHQQPLTFCQGNSIPKSYRRNQPTIWRSCTQQMDLHAHFWSL